MGFLSNLFHRDQSKNTAKKRLKFVLMHDRSDIAPEVMEALQKELIQVVSKYMDIDNAGTVCRVSKEEDVAALEVSMPVKGMKRASAILADIAERNRE